LGNGIWAAGDARKGIVLDFLWNFLKELMKLTGFLAFLDSGGFI
jgi:hypothetical protein